ncbi:acyl-CoA thioesterase [Ammoniphilus sp. CFH 90114]|uniref:acyl-CoA thioesterase n=1 Tax=Ammoniphilus sp. CFH 90114 TaxID=2493665 RepID=UPI00100E95D9|nr:acyl-CoA thioesterase [Ammoniphilus sp. CFH 90114]RXT02322.1 acyl-CoA thioesterase [Ammoniphilus sp. CFH 90114]
MDPRPIKSSSTVLTSLVLPPDTNHYDNIFGGKVLSYIDEVAAIAAMRHCQSAVVTASIDSVDFLNPVKKGYAIRLEAFVTWTGRSSMEVFVQVSSEDLLTGTKQLTATSFVCMVAINEEGRTVPVPPVYPESEFEKELHHTAPRRQQDRQMRKSKELHKMIELK